MAALTSLKKEMSEWRDKKFCSFRIWCALYSGIEGTWNMSNNSLIQRV